MSAVCHDLATNLSKRGISTTVFCGGTGNLSISSINANLRIVRMPVLNAPPLHFWFPIQNRSSLSQLLKNFNVIHFVDTRAAGLILNYIKNHKGAVISHVHVCGHCETKAFVHSPISTWSPGEFAYTVLEFPLNEHLTGNCLRNSKELIFCSKTGFDEIKRRQHNIDYSKATVIYNGIKFDKFKNQTVPTEKSCSILYWGRLFYIKGAIHLIKALAIVKNQYPSVTLDICGKGPLESHIKNMIKNLGLEKNVVMNGYVPDDILINKIKAASIVVLPSLYEGQPVAALEAMACKKALIMYDYPFIREIIRDGDTGLLAKPADTDDLANKICQALSDKHLRAKLGDNAYEHVRKHHDWDNLIDKYVALYKNSLNSLS